MAFRWAEDVETNIKSASSMAWAGDKQGRHQEACGHSCLCSCSAGWPFFLTVSLHCSLRPRVPLLLHFEPVFPVICVLRAGLQQENNTVVLN